MNQQSEIEACVQALQKITKLDHVSDELRGAVWEFFLSNPKENCSPNNKRLRRFLTSTLQLKSAFTDISDIRTDAEGETFSIIDLAASNDATPENLIIEAQTPEIKPDPEEELALAKNRFLEKRHLLSWRHELMLRMKASGESCARIALYFGLSVNTVYLELTMARNKVRDAELLKKPIPKSGVIRLKPLCVGSLIRKRSKP